MSSNINTRSQPSSGTSPNTATNAPSSSKKKECYVFEPQQWRKSICKNCFRSAPDHPTEPPNNNSQNNANVSGPNNNGKAGISPRTSPLMSTKTAANSQGNKEQVLRKNETSPNTRRRPKSDEFKQKTPSPRETKRSLTSGTTGRRSPATSPSSNISRNSGSFSGQHRQSSTSSIDTKYVEELENDFFDLEDRYDDLSKEKSELEKELVERVKTIDEMHEDVESYKNKIAHFERRVQHLEEEIRSYRERLKLPESDQASGEVKDDLSGEREELLAENDQLRIRLEELEQLCQEVMEENEMLKEEQEEMQREIEEMHDHFQEDDTDTLRELKRDLETSNKNCRIFQFKLRKTERRYEQCENERAALEEKLSRLEAQLYSENDVNLIRGLEEELRVAKEVSVRLNSELELVDEKRAYFEEDNKHMKEDLKDSDLRRKSLESELSKCRQEIEKLKSMEPSGALQIPEPNSMRRSKNLEALSRDPSFEEQSLQREVDAAKERETDLNEQLKFSEDEIHKLKRRLNDAEEENDSLSKKLETMVKNKTMDDSDYEDASVQAMKIQLDLLEQQNSTLRKKFVSIERENLKLISDFKQLKSKGNNNSLVEESLDENYKSMEKKIFDIQSDMERLEKENRRLTILNSLNSSANQNQSQNVNQQQSKLKDTATMLYAPTDQQSTHPTQTTVGNEAQETTTEFIQAAQLQELKVECTRLKEQVRQYDKSIKNILTQMEPQDMDKKQLDLFKKYTDSVESCREQEKLAIQMRRQVESLREECARYKEHYEQQQQQLNSANTRSQQQSQDKSSRSDTKADLEHASKTVLLEEIVCLEEEIDELASKCEKAESKIAVLTDTIQEKEKIIDEMLIENEKNEKELNQYIDHLLTKNALLSDLLNCVEARANELQMQFDRTMSLEESGGSSSDTTTTTTTDNSSGVGANQAGIAQSLLSGGPVSIGGSKNVGTRTSAGSDDVFNDPGGFQINVPGNLNDAEKIKFRLSCMERLLSEERKRTRIAEKQAEMALRDSVHSRVSDDSQLKKKEIEMLKSDLDEKNEMLEEKEQHINDLKVRLDQTRKMNEALRTLLDKQDEAPTVGYSKKSEPLTKEQMIEINSYKKEISALKSDIHQYILKINESEKIREKLAKEIRNLQADIKIREEQFYEQDDEMRAKDQELKSLKKLLEEAQKNLRNQTDNEHIITENKKKTEQIENMQKEIETLNTNVQFYKNQVEELEMEIRQQENQQKILSDTVRTRDERIKEKDDIITHINQRLQNREKELTDIDVIIKQSNDKLTRSQESLKENQTLLSQKELELKSFRSKFDELQTTHDKCVGNINVIKADNEKLRLKITDLEKDKSSTTKTIPMSTSASEAVERLRGEVNQLKRDKENLATQLAKEKSNYHGATGRRDSGTNKQSESEAYTRAIQQQQYVTRVSLLSDNVTRLNRQNIELKLHNESVQNDMLEYQRRFKNIKEQYEAEQESWVAERITLESRMKEHEDRKSAIVSLRKSLQDASLKVADLESQLNKERQESCMKINDLEQVKNDLQKKLSHYEEQQKLPKVLQRFGGKMSSRSTNESVLDKEKTELKVRLETAEKSINKLRTELVEKEDKFSREKINIMKRSEEARVQLDNLVQNLTIQLAEMEGCKEQVYLLRERLHGVEESHDRDRKIWNEERMCLQFKIEDSRMLIENWLNKLRECENDDYKNSTDLIDSLEKELEKYLHSKDTVPYSQLRRRLNLATGSGLMDSSLLSVGPGRNYLGTPPISINSKISPLKAVSLDWTNNNRLMSQSQSTGSDVANSNQSLAGSSNIPYRFLRNNRSVSPDMNNLATITTKKVTNYPDPTPGFLLKPSSRQGSTESVGSTPGTDYTQRSFTLPGLRNNRNASRTSPARQKFFESNDSASSTLPKPNNIEKKPENNVDLKPKTVTTSAASSKSETNVKTPQSIVTSKINVENATSNDAVKTDTKTTKPEALPPTMPVKTTKSKSISIAPSIQQLRMRFAQKSEGSSNSLDGGSSSQTKK